MTFKRLVLIILTIGAVALLTLNLLSSFLEPQFQSRLELYQTDITLQAQEWKLSGKNETVFKQLQAAIIGDKPLETAIQRYQGVRNEVKTTLKQVKQNLEQAKQLSTQSPLHKESDSLELLAKIREQEYLLSELDLRLGILQAKLGQVDAAKQTWKQVQQNQDTNSKLKLTAALLTELWNQPSTLESTAPELIKENLDSWFRDTTLLLLYQSQQSKQELSALQAAQQSRAKQALYKLAMVTGIPELGSIIGLGLLLLLIGQRLIKGKDSLFAQNADLAWTTPWDVETIL